MQFTEAEYTLKVQPFVAAWERAKEAYDAEQNKPLTLEEAVAAKKNELIAQYTAAFTPVEEVYPAAEREGWAIQEAEAKAVLINPAAETPVISQLIALRARGETVAEFAHKVLENAEKWRTVYAFLTGQQQKMYADLSDLTGKVGCTVEDVLGFKVEYILPAL